MDSTKSAASEARELLNHTSGADAADAAKTAAAGFWDKAKNYWDQPSMQRLRLSVNVANFTVKLPAILAVVAAQIGVFASTASLPMLAPLLVGSGFALRSIAENAGQVCSCVLAASLVVWGAWFANYLAHNTVAKVLVGLNTKGPNP